MPARHAILGLLVQRPLHGYDIDGEFERGLRSFCPVNISQIYAYLKNMEENGWIESELILQKSNPPKKVFHVTQRGRDEMAQWLRQPIGDERHLRDELLTKIYFCWLLDPELLSELVEQHLAILKQRLRQAEQRLAEPSDGIFGLMADAGRRHAQADYEWLIWMREQLRERADTLSPEAASQVEPVAEAIVG